MHACRCASLIGSGRVSKASSILLRECGRPASSFEPARGEAGEHCSPLAGRRADRSDDVRQKHGGVLRRQQFEHGSDLTDDPAVSLLRTSLIAAYNDGRSTPSSEPDRMGFGSRLTDSK